MSNQKYTYSSKIYQIVVQDKEIYKSLINCAITTTKNFNKYKNNEVINEEKTKEKNDATLIETLFASNDFDDSIFLSIQSSRQSKQRANQRDKSLTKNNFKKLLNLSNVHVA